MSYDCLLDTLRRSATDASATRPQLFRPRVSLPSPSMESVFVTIANHDEFYRLLDVHGSAGRVLQVMWCRLYQHRSDRSPEYDVWFLAVLVLKHARIELRQRCGSQDFDRDSEKHPASRQAARCTEELVTHCALLGLEARETSYEEMF